MSPPGRPKGEYRSAKREGTPPSPPGRPKGEYRSAKREGTPPSPPGRPKGEYRSAKREGTPPSAPPTPPYFAVVLVEPEIPPNTGNVIRLTANTDTELHLVEPLGFRMDDRELKRAGLDYHEYARVRVHRDFAACRAALEHDGPRRWFAFTTDGPMSLYATRFQPKDVLVFGRESSGLSAEIRALFPPDATLRIPMRPEVRSLNLSNAVAVAVYEAWRQAGFAGGR